MTLATSGQQYLPPGSGGLTFGGVRLGGSVPPPDGGGAAGGRGFTGIGVGAGGGCTITCRGTS